jgi:hypothetical protein
VQGLRTYQYQENSFLGLHPDDWRPGQELMVERHWMRFQSSISLHNPRQYEFFWSLSQILFTFLFLNGWEQDLRCFWSTESPFSKSLVMLPCLPLYPQMNAPTRIRSEFPAIHNRCRRLCQKAFNFILEIPQFTFDDNVAKAFRPWISLACQFLLPTYLIEAASQ